MGNAIQLLDTVAVLGDQPPLGLSAGEVGTVVDLLADGVFEVEFSDATGATYAMHPLRADQLVALHTRGESLRLRQAAA